MSATKDVSLLDFVKHFKTTLLGRKLVPLESSFGFPIPVQLGKKLLFKLFYYTARPEEKGKAAIYAPIVEFTFEYETKRVVAFKRLECDKDYSDIYSKEIIGYFPHDSIRKMKKSEYLSMQKEIYDLIESFCKHKLSGTPVSTEQAQKLSRGMRMLISPCLIPYYKKMNQKFISKLLSN